MTVLDDLRASGSIARLAEHLLPNGHPEQGGSVWRAGGTDGNNGRSLTCSLVGDDSGMYHDHATGDGGSLVQLVMELHRLETVSEARQWLIDNGFINRAAPPTPPPIQKFSGRTEEAAPNRAKPPSTAIRVDGKQIEHSDRWRYMTADGRTAFWVLRYDLPDGSKQHRSIVWGTRTSHGGKTLTGWQSRGYPEPRPIYGLPNLLAYNDRPIIVVEGEKTADAAAKWVPESCAVTSAGGSKAAKKSNWAPAATDHRVVFLLPDNDEAGEQYISSVGAELRAAQSQVQLRRVDPVKLAKLFGIDKIDPGWDIADIKSRRDPLNIGELNSVSTEFEPPPELRRTTRAKASRQSRNDAVAIAVNSLNSEELAFVDGEFWELRTTHWEPIREDALFRRVAKALDDAGEEVKPNEGRWLTSADHRETLHDLRAVATPESVNVLDAAKQTAPFHLDTGKVTDGVAFGNGVLSLNRDGEPEISAHEPRIFRRWSLPYDWTMTRQYPERFMKHLAQVYQDDEELILLTAELIGYTLSGDRSAQIVPLMQGAPRSGKGVILDILVELLGGPERVSTPKDPAQLAGRFGLGDAATKAAIIIGDMPATPNTKTMTPFHEGMNLIKAISGNSPIQIERKNRDPADVRLPVVIWMANNWKVGWVKGAEDVTAWMERLIILPFDRTIAPPDRVNDLYRIIIHEDGLDAIANFCLYAYFDARQRGNGLRIDWTVSERSRSMLTEIVSGAAGTAAQFINTRMAFLPDAWTSRKQIIESYGMLLRRKPSSSEANTLYTALRNRVGVADSKRKGITGFRGVAMGEPGIQEPPGFDGFNN